MRLRHLPAHLLTLARLPLAGVIWLDPGDRVFFLLVLATGGLTDVLDGFLARVLDKGSRTDPTNVGAWLDPLCDKIFAASCIAAAFWAWSPPGWIVASLLAREIFQVPILVAYFLTWARRGIHVDFRAVPLGKATTVLQTLSLTSLLFFPAALPFLAPVTGVLGVSSVVVVVRRALGARPPQALA